MLLSLCQLRAFSGVMMIAFDVRSVLHGQVSLAAVNQIFVVREAMNGCKYLKIH